MSIAGKLIDMGRSTRCILVIWFAIFSCRREAELTRLSLGDYDQHHTSWKVHDLKNLMAQKETTKHLMS